MNRNPSEWKVAHQYAGSEDYTGKLLSQLNGLERLAEKCGIKV